MSAARFPKISVGSGADRPTTRPCSPTSGGARRRADYEIVVVDTEVTTLPPVPRRHPHFPRCAGAPRDSSGQSASLWTGVRLARAPWIVTLDGDGQNDPADIPALLAARDARRSDRLLLVNGHRRSRHDSWVKRVSSRIANAVRGKVLGDGTPDTGCGLKLFSREAFLALPRFDHMHRFIPALVRRNGGEILSVPVRHRERVHGRSHYGVRNRLWTGIVDMLGVLWLQRRATNPELARVGSASASEEAQRPAAREEER